MYCLYYGMYIQYVHTFIENDSPVWLMSALVSPLSYQSKLFLEFANLQSCRL